MVFYTDHFTRNESDLLTPTMGMNQLTDSLLLLVTRKSPDVDERGSEYRCKSEYVIDGKQ